MRGQYENAVHDYDKLKTQKQNFYTTHSPVNQFGVELKYQKNISVLEFGNFTIFSIQRRIDYFMS